MNPIINTSVAIPPATVQAVSSTIFVADVAGSLGSNQVTRHRTAGIDIVRKTPTNPGISMEKEITATRMMQGLKQPDGHGLRVAEYISHTTETLETRWIPARRDPHWRETDFLHAAGTLQLVAEVLAESKLGEIVTYSVMGHAGDRRDFNTGVLLMPQAEARLAQSAVEGFFSFPLNAAVLGHCDTRPENWVLSGDGPVLIDFGCVGYAPPGWDVALLLAHAVAPTGMKRELATELMVDWGLVQQIAGFHAGLTFNALSHSPAPIVRAWGAKYFTVFIDLLNASE